MATMHNAVNLLQDLYFVLMSTPIYNQAVPTYNLVLTHNIGTYVSYNTARNQYKDKQVRYNTGWNQQKIPGPLITQP